MPLGCERLASRLQPFLLPPGRTPPTWQGGVGLGTKLLTAQRQARPGVAPLSAIKQGGGGLDVVVAFSWATGP